ncbi:DUF7521 family protein [Halomarina rubra]|uniref:Cation:proton antiporter n=1 Tax=Halomarina rubra TaxID=2071873 RepID=A0ABD6AXR5_9EURY|nr:hypothetical protein [Halomarina rubra]
MTHVTTILVALKTITLALGGLITFFAYRAYQRTAAQALGALALGFAFITLGALLAGAAHQAFNMDTDVVLVIESTLTAAGFGIIVYSLYAE